MKRNRAFRRAKMQIIKKRVQHYYGGYACNSSRLIGKLAQTRVPCSCAMCGNPRKYFKEKTVQEKRSVDILNDPDMPEYDWEYNPAQVGYLGEVVVNIQYGETGEIESLGDFPIIDVTGDN